MKLFSAVLALAFSAAATAEKTPEPAINIIVGDAPMHESSMEGPYEPVMNEFELEEQFEEEFDMEKSGMEESDIEDEGFPMSDDEMEALFLDDMAHGVGILTGDPDYEEEMEDWETGLGGGRALRGRQLQSSRYVLLCRHSNCRGGHYWASPGWYSSMPWQIGNDALTRVYIPARHTFTYYEHSGFRGWRRTFGEPNRRVNLFMGGHNDAVSSFVIRRF